MAAGRRTSVDTSSGCRPCRTSHFASFAAVVVLPDALQAEQQDDARRLDVGVQPALRVAEQRDASRRARS